MGQKESRDIVVECSCCATEWPCCLPCVTHNQELDGLCNPILSKPKPKIEAPGDGQSKANGEHNGPVNGQSATETKPEPAKDNPQQTKPPGEMEVD